MHARAGRNGSPTADPCAIDPDGPAGSTTDAGVTMPDGGGGTGDPSGGGCGCDSQKQSAPWPLFVIGLLWFLRSRRT